MTDKKELNTEEMEKVSGGSEFPKEAAGGFKIVVGPLISSTENGVTTEYFPTSEKKDDSKGGNVSNGSGKINLTQPNNNEKSNQLTNVEGPNTQTNNNFNFN